MGSECNSIKNKRFHLITRIDLNRKNLDNMYLKQKKYWWISICCDPNYPPTNMEENESGVNEMP